MNGSGKADYIITGQWAKKAYQEAQKYGDVQAVASSADKTFSYIPKTAATDFRDDADYVYICMNNTIYGTVYKELPPVGDKCYRPMCPPVLCPNRWTSANSAWCTSAHKRMWRLPDWWWPLSGRICWATHAPPPR